MPDLADVIEIDLSGVECAYFREWTDPEGEAEYLLFDQDGGGDHLDEQSIDGLLLRGGA